MTTRTTSLWLLGAGVCPVEYVRDRSTIQGGGAKMRRIALGWLVALAIVSGPVSAGVNQWTPAGPDGGSFRDIRYLGNGLAIAVTLRSIYRTADHGVTWTRVHDIYGSGNGVGTSIAVNPANTSQILVMGFTALYCSSDGGLTFTQVNDIGSSSVNSL